MRLLDEYPEGHVGDPTRESVDEVSLESWWLDADGTRYRLLVGRLDDETLLCAGVGSAKGDWAVFARVVPAPKGSDVAWSYLAEKLKLRDGDRPGFSRLIAAATGWEVF
jgi:hypothetical protein